MNYLENIFAENLIEFDQRKRLIGKSITGLKEAYKNVSKREITSNIDIAVETKTNTDELKKQEISNPLFNSIKTQLDEDFASFGEYINIRENELIKNEEILKDYEKKVKINFLGLKSNKLRQELEFTGNLGDIIAKYTLQKDNLNRLINGGDREDKVLTDDFNLVNQSLTLFSEIKRLNTLVRKIRENFRGYLLDKIIM